MGPTRSAGFDGGDVNRRVDGWRITSTKEYEVVLSFRRVRSVRLAYGGEDGYTEARVKLRFCGRTLSLDDYPIRSAWGPAGGC
jgi:hypothetical protein